jgi:phosphoglycerate dehydrogenase-like enzyme
MASSTHKGPYKLAILDDNLDVSAPHFASIPKDKVEITIFKDTLPPYNHPTTSDADKAALVNRLKPFDIISTMRERTPFPKALFDELPNLKLFLVTGGRHMSFELDAARNNGFTAAAALGDSRRTGPKPKSDLSLGLANATTQHTWALLLALARNVVREDVDMREGGWQTAFALGLQGKTLGIVGLGRLGVSTARIAVIGFGMKVVAWSANLTQEKADETAKELGLPVEYNGKKVFKVVSKEELLKTSDAVSVHYTLSPRSIGLIGKPELDLMKKEAILINTSRGPLIDEAALLETLEKGGIRGAALDVFDIEPLPKNHPFRSKQWGKDGRSDLIVSPHVGYLEKEGLDVFYAETAENLQRWLDGKEVLNKLF